MYYGENIFVSHPSLDPIYKNGCTYLFGLMLYPVSKGETVILYYGHGYGDTKAVKCTVEGVIEHDFKYCEKPFGKRMPDSRHDELACTLNSLISSGNISDKCDILYPCEEKYSILVLKNEIRKDQGCFWVYKDFTPEYGPVAFEAETERPGRSEYYSSDGAVRLAGIVYSRLNEGGILMMIDDEADTRPKLFHIKEIFFRGKRTGWADPAMRRYQLLMTCSCDVHINDRARFVKYIQ